MLRTFLFLSKRSFAAAAAAPAATTASSDSNQLVLTLASPDTAFYTNKVVKQVDVPTLAGSVGVLANHVPTIGVLKSGIVSIIEEDGKVEKLFVSSGTLSVNIDGSVQVLAEEALKIEDIDEALAKKELENGQRKMTEATNDVERAEASIRIEVADALLKAASGQQ